MAGKTPEGRVKDAIKKWLKAEGLLTISDLAQLRFAAEHQKAEPSAIPGWFWMPVQGEMSVHGVHDFVGCWHGVFFSIEAKSGPKAAVTDAQLDVLFGTQLAGGVSMVVWDAGQMDELKRRIHSTSERIHAHPSTQARLQGRSGPGVPET